MPAHTWLLSKFDIRYAVQDDTYTESYISTIGVDFVSDRATVQ